MRLFWVKQNEREGERERFLQHVATGLWFGNYCFATSTRAEEKSQATVVACSSIIFSAFLIIPVTGERPEHPKPMRGKEQFWAAPS